MRRSHDGLLAEMCVEEEDVKRSVRHTHYMCYCDYNYILSIFLFRILTFASIFVKKHVIFFNITLFSF